MAMSPAQDKAETGRSISVLCLLGGAVLLAVCVINPTGVYEPWGLTFGACVFFVIGSACSLAYYHSRVLAEQSDE